MRRSDPDVFVVAAEVADVAAYGLSRVAELRGSGAALTYEDAVGAAVGEAAERFACAVIPAEELIFGSYEELSSHAALVEPDHWALYTPEQCVPYAAFRPDTPIAWVAAEAVAQRDSRLVPASLVYMPYVPAFATRGECVVGDAISTGTACSRNRADALLRGILEVIERDAFMVVWRHQLAIPRLRIDDGSALYPLFHRHFLRPGLEYHLFLTTLDLPVTSVFGYLRDTRCRPPSILAGGAAHHDPSRAVLKTLLELVQGLKWRDWDGFEPLAAEPGFANVRTFDHRMRLYASNDMTPALDFLDDGTPAVALSTIRSVDRGIAANLRNCVASLAARGLDVLALDLTTTDLAACGLHVVKTLIPQCTPMEGDHLMPFLGGHRWRQLPMQLGRTLANAEPANPYPHPYP